MPMAMERDLTADEFKKYHDLIYKIAGIHYPTEKLELLSNRIRRRLRATNDPSFLSYLARITQPRHADEQQAFLDSITTNETYFFRCQAHWDHFRDWLTERKKDPALQRNGLRLWSAAASNGAEACTMLIVLHQVFGDDFGGMKVEILGTDLSTAILAEAQQATFRQYALSQTPKDVVARYFRHDKDSDKYEFDRGLLRNVRFERHNLMDRLATRAPFDAVFLRNVMIYFDKKSREHVLSQTAAVMRPGGLLIVGESESLLSVAHDFDYVKPSIFVKPAAGAAPKPRPTTART